MKNVWIHSLIVLVCAVAFDAAWSALAPHILASHASPTRTHVSLNNSTAGSDAEGSQSPSSDSITTEVWAPKDGYGNPPCLLHHDNTGARRDSSLPCYQTLDMLGEYCTSLSSLRASMYNTGIHTDPGSSFGIGYFDPDNNHTSCHVADNDHPPAVDFPINFNPPEPDFVDSCKFATADATNHATKATRMEPSPNDKESDPNLGAEIVCS